MGTALKGGEGGEVIGAFDLLWFYHRYVFCSFSLGKPTGYDRVRNAEIGNKVFQFCFSFGLLNF